MEESRRSPLRHATYPGWSSIGNIGRRRRERGALVVTVITPSWLTSPRFGMWWPGEEGWEYKIDCGPIRGKQ